LFNFDTHKGSTVKNYIILVCTQQQWALQVTPVGFLPLKSLLIKNNKKIEAALKNVASGDKKQFFFTWPNFKFILVMFHYRKQRLSIV